VKRIPLSIRKAFNFAWPIFKKRFGLFTAVLLTIFGAWVALEIVVIAGQRFGILLRAVAHLAFLVFVAGVEVGFLRICLALCDGGEPTYAGTYTHLAFDRYYGFTFWSPNINIFRDPRWRSSLTT